MEEVASSSKAAKVVAGATASSSKRQQTQGSEGDHMMKTEDTDLRQIRKACGNSLWTAGAVLCKDGLQHLAAITQELCRPFYTSHSRNAQLVKSRQATVEWYTCMAQGQWLDSLKEACAVCKNPVTLAKMGFDTSFTELPASASLEDPRLLEQDLLAHQALKLLLNRLYYWTLSMSWHTEGWPGLLALL